MAEPIKRRNPHRAVGESNQDAITRLAGERDAALHDAARLREIEAAAREWLTVPRRERYADQLDAAHQRLVDALADALDLEAGLADVLGRAKLDGDT